MGTYTYKVTAATVPLTNGDKANVALYAYKPIFVWGRGHDKSNAKMHRRSGCINAETYARKGKLTPYIVVDTASGSEVFTNLNRTGTFYDDNLGERDGALPLVEGVAVA